MQGLQQNAVDAPFIAPTFASSEASFMATKSPNFYALRDVASASASSTEPKIKTLISAATKYGSKNVTNTNFTKGWIAGELIAEGLKACADHCTAADVYKTVSGLNKFDTGGLCSPLSYTAGSTNHLGIRGGSVYKWDSSKSAAVVSTPSLKVPDGYSPTYS
jgi:hypothetical protein